MTHRTTFALDEQTAQRLKRLAARWNVSQAEVVRRSVEQAEHNAESSKPDAITLLKRLHAQGGGIDKAQADQWIEEVFEDRKHWRASS
ncbi:MAG: ribbon-helix-helix protein, CopG family [Opitutales bacterium]|nr:ribbon-helix-helix protein, CopG family [Opitutales bacterium]